MIDLIIIGFVAISVTDFVITKDEQKKPENLEQTQTGEHIK